MISETITFIAALLALLGSILSLFISARLAIQKERRQLLWSKELDRFFQLEELAGQLVETVGGYAPLPENDPDITQKLLALGNAAGRFSRYPAVRLAIQDLDNVLGRVYAEKRDSAGDWMNSRQELDPTFRQLLVACDQVVGRQKIDY